MTEDVDGMVACNFQIELDEMLPYLQQPPSILACDSPSGVFIHLQPIEPIRRILITLVRIIDAEHHPRLPHLLDCIPQRTLPPNPSARCMKVVLEIVHHVLLVRATGTLRSNDHPVVYPMNQEG